MLNSKPRKSGEILRPKTNHSSSLRRGPKKTFVSSSRSAFSQEIDELREKLIENPDFSGIEMPKLIQLQENTQRYISVCVQEKRYNDTKKVQNFDTLLTAEIQRQSAELDHFLQTQTARTKFEKSKEITRTYVFFLSIFIARMKRKLNLTRKPTFCSFLQEIFIFNI